MCHDDGLPCVDTRCRLLWHWQCDLDHRSCRTVFGEVILTDGSAPIAVLAERLLSEAQWVSAAARFRANSDPLYGGDTAQDFKALFSRIGN
jgi:hypothetical protein